MQCYSKDQIYLEGSLGLAEQNYYWLYINEKITLVKINTLNPPKDLQYVESELIIEDSKLKIIEKEEFKKLNYNDRYIFFPYDPSQIDYQNNDFTTIPLINYASIMQILKFKFLKNLYYVRAGKITLGINFTNEPYLNYDSFSKINFNFTREELNNNTFIINGVPNSGKTSLHVNLIFNIIHNNSFGFKNANEEHFNELNSELMTQIKNKNQNINRQFLDRISSFVEFINMFGNCIENEFRFDSSRFMRLSKISNKDVDFLKADQSTIVIKFKHYLLEKSRILRSNCFLFHIFHLVINGLAKLLTNEDYKSTAFNKYPEYAKSLFETFQEYKYFIINTSIVFEDIYFTDSISKYYEEKFIVFMKICEEIGFHKKILIKIINIVLIILLLKSLEYTEDKDGNAVLDIKSNDFQMIIKLMNLETEEEIALFTKKLTTREMSIGLDPVFEINFKLEEAYRIKDNFIKYLYENLFFFVEKISNILIKEYLENLNNSNKDEKSESDVKSSSDNSLINVNNDDNKNSNCKSKKANDEFFVQIVECFGFDNDVKPENNSLENLFVNYANDRINNLFFDQLINNEIKLYEQEGISNNELKTKLGLKNLKSLNEAETNNDIKKVDQIKSNAAVDDRKRRSTINSRKGNLNPINTLDNSEIDKTLNICDDESRGLFRLLDEGTFLINNNKGLITSLIDKIRNYWPDVKTTENTFFLNHFGALVEYGAPDFIYKNIENIPNELKFIAKNVFKNLFSLTIKNFKLDRDKNLNQLMKKFNKENIEESTKKDNLLLNSSKGGERLSVTRRISKNTIKGRTNSEKFLETFRRLLIKIKNTKLKIIKLINTSAPKVDSNNYISQNETLVENNISRIKTLEFLINPRLSNPFEIFERHDLMKNIGQICNEVHNNTTLNQEETINNFHFEPDAFNNLFLKHKFLFDDKYVLKQIFSSGIMESIQLAKSGFFIRCDYITLGKKLILFKSYFEDDFKFIKDMETWDLEKDSKEYNIKVEQMLENWKPEKELIKKISTITNIDEANFILGKKLLFVSNKALAANPNLSFCGEFSKLIIKSMFKNIIKKVKNIKSVQKNFFRILKKRKIDVLSNVVQKSKIKFSFRKFFTQLTKKSNMIGRAVNKIQFKFRKYILIKNKIIKLQRHLRRFLNVKLKDYRMRKLIYRLLLIEDSFSRRWKILAFDSIKDLASIRLKYGSLINKNIEKYLRSKRFKEFTSNLCFILNRIILIKNREKGYFRIKSYLDSINKIIKIQNSFRIKKSQDIKKILIFERDLRLAREHGLNKLLRVYESILASNKKVFFVNIKDLGELRSSKAQFIKKHYLLYKGMKKKHYNLQFKKRIVSCNAIIEKYLKLNKFTLLNNFIILNQEIKLKQRHSAVLIQKLFRFKKSKKIYEALKLKKQEELEEKSILIYNKLEMIKYMLDTKAELSFLNNLKMIQIESVQKEKINKGAIKIQLLFKKLISTSRLNNLRMKKHNFQLNTCNLLTLADKCVSLKKKDLFFFKFKYTVEEIILKNKSATLIQSVARCVKAKKKYSHLKYEDLKMKEIRKNAMSKISFILNECLRSRKDTTFKTIKIFSELRFKSTLILQNNFRKFLSIKRYKNLRFERESLLNNLNKFNHILDHTKQILKIKLLQGALSEIKNHVQSRNANALKLQTSVRRKNSIIKARNLKELHIREQEESRKNCFNKAFSILDHVSKDLRIKRFNNLLENIKIKIGHEAKLNRMFNLLEINLNNVNKLQAQEGFDKVKKYSQKKWLNKILTILCSTIQNIHENSKARCKRNSLNDLLTYSHKIRKVIKLQTYIRSRNAILLCNKLRREVELQKLELAKQKNLLFIQNLISIHERLLFNKHKSDFFNKLYLNKEYFNERIIYFKRRISVNKINKFLKFLLNKKKIKMLNLCNFLKTMLSITGKEVKILKYYFAQFKKNYKIFGLVRNFIYNLESIRILNKYLRKKYFKILFDEFINKKIAKNILKKSFFKKYRNIIMDREKKEGLALIKEFAKVFRTINQNKNCKVKTTQDTFSVIYSNINIVDDYKPENKKNENLRLSANPINKGNLNQEKKLISSETNKANPLQTRFTVNINPLKNKKTNPSKGKTNLPISNNPIKIDSKLNPIVKKNTFSENSKSNYPVKGKKEDKSKSKSPIPKYIKKNDILNKMKNIPDIPLIKNENSVENFFSNSNDNNLFEKDPSETNLDNIFDLKKELKNNRDDKANNLIGSTKKSITNYKQTNNYKIKSFLNSDSKIQRELDLLTSELDDLIKDAGTVKNSNKLKTNLKNTNLDFSSLNNNDNDQGIDYRKLNQEYRRNQLKKIENPLDTDFRNIETDNILSDNNNLNDVLKIKRIQNPNRENYEKLAFKRVCLSDFPKSIQAKK